MPSGTGARDKERNYLLHKMQGGVSDTLEITKCVLVTKVTKISPEVLFYEGHIPTAALCVFE